MLERLLRNYLHMKQRQGRAAQPSSISSASSTASAPSATSSAPTSSAPSSAPASASSPLYGQFASKQAAGGRGRGWRRGSRGGATRGRGTGRGAAMPARSGSSVSVAGIAGLLQSITAPTDAKAEANAFPASSSSSPFMNPTSSSSTSAFSSASTAAPSLLSSAGVAKSSASTFSLEEFEHFYGILPAPHVIIQSLAAKKQVLRQLRPKYVIMFDPDVGFFRQLEVRKKYRHFWNLFIERCVGLQGSEPWRPAARVLARVLGECGGESVCGWLAERAQRIRTPQIHETGAHSIILCLLCACHVFHTSSL